MPASDYRVKLSSGDLVDRMVTQTSTQSGMGGSVLSIDAYMDYTRPLSIVRRL